MVLALLGLAASPRGCGAPRRDVEGGDGDAILAAALRDRVHDLQVHGRGIVVSLRGDDTEGDHHQRFVIRLESGHTLLVAHSVHVASLAEGLGVGDSVWFSGVYEQSADGGTVRWTHAEPDGEHAPEWLRHGGRTNQRRAVASPGGATRS